MKKTKKIAVLGLWHMGCVYSACLAGLGFEVAGFDYDTKTLENLKKGIPPIFEPGLSETINKHLNKSLTFSSSLKKVCKGRDYIFITYDIPVDEHDKLNLLPVDKTIGYLSNILSSDQTIVISSQIPVSSTTRYTKILRKKGLNNNIIYFPENLRLGNAMEIFYEPERIILGCSDLDTIDRFISDFPVFECKKYKMSAESAEMVKHALNCYLASSISFSSEISDLCEILGADMEDVVEALKSDKRIGLFAPINPGLGFSGGTLARDIQTLKKIGVINKYRTKMIDAIYEVNTDRLKYLIFKIQKIYPVLKNRNISLLGLTYKPFTDTLKRSLSISLSVRLLEKGANVKAYDPAITNSIPKLSKITVVSSYEELFDNSDMILLMTPWKVFREIPLDKLSKLVKHKVIIDTKNFLDGPAFQKYGFQYISIGRRDL